MAETTPTTWAGTSVRHQTVYRHHAVWPRRVTKVEPLPHGVLLTLGTDLYGFDRREGFDPNEGRRKKLGEGETLYCRIRGYAPEIFRIELLDAAALAAEPVEYFLHDATPAEPELDDGEDMLRLTLGSRTLLVDKGETEPGIFRLHMDGPDGAEQFSTANQEDGIVFWSYPPGKRIDTETGASWWRDDMLLAPGERIYGFGEKFNPLDKRGRDIHLWHDDAHGCGREVSYKNVPLFLSSRKYGVFVNTPAPVRAEVGAFDSHTLGLDVHDDRVDYFLLPGRSMQEALAKYAALTGPARMAPRWTFGIWQSKLTYKTETELDEVIEGYRKHDLPLTVLCLDPGWLRVSVDWEWAPERFPDPAAMLKRFREDGLRVSLWQMPYIRKQQGSFSQPGSETQVNEAFVEGVEKGYFAKNPDGSLFGTGGEVTPGDVEGVIDFSNPDAKAWYQEKIRRLYAAGVACIKTDFGENAPPEAVYERVPGFKMHNLYPKLYNEAVYEVIDEFAATEGVVWARSATAGCHRIPIHWGGDNCSSWLQLASSLWGGLSFGMSGGLFWSCDTAGFGSIEQTEEELYIRWVQFGMMQSHMRLHGYFPREPWNISDEAVAVFRKWGKLRYRLVPYLVSEARHCVDVMRPLMCAMPLAFEDDPTCLAIDDQYMLGRSLLVAPLLRPGGKRRVYLPEGTWFRLETGETTDGGRWIDVACAIDEFPVYVQDGSLLPLMPERNRIPDGPFEELAVRVYRDRVAPVPYRLEDDPPATLTLGADGTVTSDRDGLAVSTEPPAGSAG